MPTARSSRKTASPWKEKAMPYVLSVENKEAYLHITVTGDNTPENVANYLSEVRNKCVEHQCSKVLIEENLRGPSLGTGIIYNIVTEAGNRVWPRDVSLALCFWCKPYYRACQVRRISGELCRGENSPMRELGTEARSPSHRLARQANTRQQRGSGLLRRRL
jgi:hypothetical protein